MGDREAAMARFRAAAGPKFRLFRRTVSRPVPSLAASARDAVPSVEPSSTTINSAVSGWASADCTARPMVFSAFMAATTTHTEREPSAGLIMLFP